MEERLSEPRRHLAIKRFRLALGVAAAVVLLGGGVVAGVAVARRGPHARSSTRLPRRGPSGSDPTSTTSPVPPSPITVTSISPANGDAPVKGTAHIKVTFSARLSSGSPMPELSPHEGGTWVISGSRGVVFIPTVAFFPLTQVRVVVPAGASGVRAADGGHLAHRVVDTFRVADGSTRRLQQLLSLLDYSPLSFHSSASPIAPSDLAAQRAALFDPPAGTFAWRNSGWPHQLTALWQVGSFGVMTKGLVMEFQADHELIPNGSTSSTLWRTLLSALAAGEANTGGYNYALAEQVQPESLTVWHDGRVVLHAPANTGIAQAPTANGNFNVFARFRSQVMRGTNPDGSKYADPVQYVAYFNGGDAVHYIQRADYGIPQSLGCVELDLSDAAKAWPYLAYGTIVTVAG